jgi:NAD(P)-dependent dehydrogenase (short-subunit alcohol dehydrogenase family)
MSDHRSVQPLESLTHRPLAGYELSGQVAAVTGAASGIGRAVALTLAGVGAGLVLLDIDADGGADTLRLVENVGVGAIFGQVDVADGDAVEAAMIAGVTRFGRLDLAVNCAGVNPPISRVGDDDAANWKRTIAINLTGMFNTLKSELNLLLAHGEGGAIVNLASVAGLLAAPHQAAYSASKHGVVGLTRTAAVEYARRGIRVNAVCPGPIDTPMVHAFLDETGHEATILSDGVPMRRLGTAQEVADVVLWLLSSASSYVTGQAIAVDGGLTT